MIVSILASSYNLMHLGLYNLKWLKFDSFHRLLLQSRIQYSFHQYILHMKNIHMSHHHLLQNYRSYKHFHLYSLHKHTTIIICCFRIKFEALGSVHPSIGSQQLHERVTQNMVCRHKAIRPLVLDSHRM